MHSKKWRIDEGEKYFIPSVSALPSVVNSSLPEISPVFHFRVGSGANSWSNGQC